MAELILLTQLFSTLSMVGLIWFVQIVHYPHHARKRLAADRQSSGIGKARYWGPHTHTRKCDGTGVTPTSFPDGGTAVARGFIQMDSDRVYRFNAG